MRDDFSAHGENVLVTLSIADTTRASRSVRMNWPEGRQPLLPIMGAKPAIVPARARQHLCADRVQRCGAFCIAFRALQEFFAYDLPAFDGLAWIALLRDTSPFDHTGRVRVPPIGIGLEYRFGLFLPPKLAQQSGVIDITGLILRKLLACRLPLSRGFVQSGRSDGSDADPHLASRSAMPIAGWSAELRTRDIMIPISW